MGTNDAKSAPGANTPTNATIGPMIAASEYAGDVDARPITIELTNPIAPGLSVAAASVFSPGDCSTIVPSGSGPDGAVAGRRRPSSPARRPLDSVNYHS